MTINLPLVCFAASAAALLLSGCGAGEEAAEEQTVPPAPAEQSPGAGNPKATRRMEFETRIDTVNALRGVEHRPTGTSANPEQIRYMVQIGAFADPHHAAMVQSEARKRYHLPVLNDYHAGRKLYQIRIGFFESRDNARLFRQQMIREYPVDYADSWIVQLKR
jgi:cell division septation protein DedD